MPSFDEAGSEQPVDCKFLSFITFDNEFNFNTNNHVYI